MTSNGNHIVFIRLEGSRALRRNGVLLFGGCGRGMILAGFSDSEGKSRMRSFCFRLQLLQLLSLAVRAGLLSASASSYAGSWQTSASASRPQSNPVSSTSQSTSPRNTRTSVTSDSNADLS